MGIFVFDFRYNVFEVQYSAIAIKTYSSQLYEQSRVFTDDNSRFLGISPKVNKALKLYEGC
jgi:hypothetical protein